MKGQDNFGRLLVLLCITLLGCIGLYYLPDTLFGQKIKKIDLFSDIRINPEPLSLDSLRALLEEEPEPEPLNIDSIAVVCDSTIQAGIMDSIAFAVRDSLYKVVYAAQGADTGGVRIEDYSVGHIGLRRFFSALNNRVYMNRPVRIAVMGDSFIEGDIMVADLRNEMQNKFGGNGVGFVPITSVAAQYRPTIDQRPEGWNTYSILHDKAQRYTLPGMFFEVKSDKAILAFKTAEQYRRLKKVNSLKFIYEKNEGTILRLAYSGEADTLIQELPPTETISQYVINNDSITDGSLMFTNAKGLRALGLVLEDNKGVTVDNYSLRGNSGLILEQFDPAYCASFSKVRPYDLIILQYGLNVVSDGMLEYGWYRARMVEAIKHIQRCFPESDILLLSLTDRANQYNGEFRTMPAVLALLHAQRQLARQLQIPFWNMFGAMGGENSMVKYVENNWASKDYTHMSFRGGREIAKNLMKALMLEKEFYDKAEKENR